MSSMTYQDKKRKSDHPTDHRAIGNKWQHATVNVEDNKCKMKTPEGDNV